jgi:hypothetical protein
MKGARIDYTDHHGERQVRRVEPVLIFWGSSSDDKREQWFLEARELRDELVVTSYFAMKDIHQWMAEE